MLPNSTQPHLVTCPRELIAAFNYVVSQNERHQVTDLHVRRLLNYVYAHDRNHTGVPISLKRLAKKLVLSVSTCRRVIARAVNEFGLIIVIPQRNSSGGQTYNRYTINWAQVDAILRTAINELFAEFKESPAYSQLKDASLTPLTKDDPPTNQADSSHPSANSSNCQSGPDRELSGSTTSAPATSDQPASQSHSSRSSVTRPSFNPSNCPNASRATTSDPVTTSDHFDVLLTKMQVALDLARALGVARLYNRLRLLSDKLSSVHCLASHAALCPTNSPPIKPPPQQPSQHQPFDFSQFDSSQFDFTSPLTSPPCSAPALSDHPPASGDQPSMAQPDSFLSPCGSHSCYDPARTSPSDYRLPLVDLGACVDLLLALDDLIASFTAALDCAVQHGIFWLQDRFTNLRTRVNSIHSKALQYLESSTTIALNRLSSSNTEPVCRCGSHSCYNLAPICPSGSDPNCQSGSDRATTSDRELSGSTTSAPATTDQTASQSHSSRSSVPRTNSPSGPDRATTSDLNLGRAKRVTPLLRLEECPPVPVIWMRTGRRILQRQSDESR